MDHHRTPTKPALEIALALSGGAARGTFHLGFIEALLENGVEIKAISGTSAGAVVGGALACGTSPREVLEILKSQEFRDIFKFNWLRKSLFCIDYKADVISKLFPLANLNETHIPFYACITDITNHEIIYANEGEGRTLILASCALIPIFKPIKDKDKLLGDGGILNLMPTTPLLKYNYPILGINLMPYKIARKDNFLSLIRTVLQLLFSSTLHQDIKKCKWYIARKELSDIKMFSLNKLQSGFDLGYEKGLEWCASQL